VQKQFQLLVAGMQMDHKKSRITAKNVEWKVSDKKELCSETKIILVLRNKQPLGLQDICRRAKIDRSTFYRLCRVLKHHGLIKKINGKFALWYYTESTKLWERVQKRMREAGGLLIDLEVEKLRLGDRDPITG
jgi:DNA-binding MarR family transcriptional regulator